MLLIPFTGGNARRNVPVVTFFLIGLNALVFFLWMGEEDRLREKAAAYYIESGLADMEMPFFIESRNPEYVQPNIRPEQLGLSEKYRLYADLTRDMDFEKRLLGGEWINLRHPDFEKWRHLRGRFESMRAQIVSFQYGFRPGRPTWTSAITHLFLHDGLGHLIGNMLVLWALGGLLETVFGRWAVASTYGVSGLASALLYLGVAAGSGIPLIGASGAVSGLMGAIVLMFGRSRVRFSYSIGFLSRLASFPATALSLLWIGNGILQILFTGESRTLFVMNIGGGIGGLLWGGVCVRYMRLRGRNLPEDAGQDDIAPMLDKALQRIGMLDMDGGRRLLEAVLAKNPDHCEALGHLFEMEKLDPDSQQFHITAKRLLYCLSNAPHLQARSWEAYREYRQLTQSPKLTPELYLQLSRVFCDLGRLEDAEQIIGGLLKNKPDQQGLPEALMHLADACKAGGEAEKQQYYLRLLRTRYPDAAVAGIADSLLKIKVI